MNPSADHAESKSCFCIVRKTISSLSSNTRWTTFPFDSQRTAVLNRRASWGASISWQFLEKACDKSRPFYKVICLYKDIQCPVILKVVFDARACLWIIQWVGIVLGAFSVTCGKTWLRTQHGWSSICVYPTEIAPVKNSAIYWFTCLPFVDSPRGSQNKNSSFRSLWTYLTKARSCVQGWMSVDSLSWILNNPALFISCTTCSLMSSDIWEIRRCTVLFESIQLFSTFLSQNKLYHCLGTWSINSSPVVLGFFFFTISRDTVNDASTTADIFSWKEPLASSVVSPYYVLV